VPDRELARLVADLLAIDSVNPDLIAGGAGEGQIARFVAEWLASAGLDVALDEVAPGRSNAIGVARGTGGGRTLLLNAHLDTVGVAGMERPHEPRVEGNRLFGRGAYDMKAGLAAAMLAGAAAAKAGLAGDVVVAAVADEEFASAGTEALLRGLSADAAIVTEPTELAVAVAHRGFAGFEIEATGVAAHGSRPDLGVDAIAKIGPVLIELAALDARLRAEPTHALLQSGSLHASLIEGGQEFSSYPARCLLTGERRTLPGETAEDVERELLDALARAGSDAALRLLVTRAGFEVAEDEEIVRLVRDRPAATWSACRSGPMRRCSPPPASRRCCSAPWAKARTRSSSGSIYRPSRPSGTCWSTSRGHSAECPPEPHLDCGQ
jgi:acetylornithine deacetylase